MKILKRGLLIILLIILLANLSYAATNINASLSASKFGPDSTFEGYVRFNFTESKPLDSLMVFHSGSLTHNVPLRKVLNVSGLFGNPNLIQIPETYNATGSSLAFKTVNFAGPGSNVSFGIDLNNPAYQAFDVIVESVSFDITNAGTSQPNDLRIKIGNKQVYRYQGAPTDFLPMGSSYLGDNSPDSTIDLRGGQVVCQVLNVTESGEYNIKVKAKKNASNEATIKLNATLADEAVGFVECSTMPCCSITVSSTAALTEAECNLQKNITERSEQHICVYPTGEDPEIRYFSIGLEEMSNGTGTLAGELVGGNFYLYGDYRNYNRILTGETTINLNVEDIQNYIYGENGCFGNCLLLPFNLSLASAGGITFSNLNLAYTTGAVGRTSNSFRNVQFTPESARYNGTVNLELNRLDEVTTPGSLGDYEFYASFDGVNSNHVDFEVVPAPTAFIRYGPFNPGIREEITFDGSGSSAPTGRNITSYSWDFGDNFNATGVSATHSYNSTGNYVVTLKVTDSEGIYDIDRFTVQVSNATSQDIPSLVNQTKISINSFRTSLSNNTQIADTASLLGLTQELTDIETNITSIETLYNNIIANESLNETQKTAQIAPLLQQLNSLISQVPTNLIVDSYSFSGKLTGINQIGTCCEFQTDIQKTKLLTSQQGITINSEARVVNLAYADGRSENFMIIKKDIIGTGTKVYEFVPVGLTITPNSILIGGNITPAAPNVYSFQPTTQIAYRVDTVDVAKALQTKTALLPANLEAVEVNVTEELDITFEPSVCGNKICESDEDEEVCPEDCKSGGGAIYIIIAIVIILIALVVYFGLFFKGGLLKKGAKVSDAKKLFKSEKDYAAVRAFVEGSLNKGLDENKVRVALKSKGWKDPQINGVLNDVKAARAKPKPQEQNTKPQEKRGGGFIHIKH